MGAEDGVAVGSGVDHDGPQIGALQRGWMRVLIQ